MKQTPKPIITYHPILSANMNKNAANKPKITDIVKPYVNDFETLALFVNEPVAA
jgi:hypothetical protein